MCQLVLGAGAMTAAGLRSITAKHLALSAQAAGSLIALHPLLRSALAAPVPHARRALLSPEFDRLLQVCACCGCWSKLPSRFCRPSSHAQHNARAFGEAASWWATYAIDNPCTGPYTGLVLDDSIWTSLHDPKPCCRT